MQTCVHCGRVYKYRKSSGHTKTQCNSCSTNRRRFDKKRKMVAHMGGACARCGYDRSIRALTFHHRDPTTKSFNISGSHCRSWESLARELEKCEMLCLNCHAEHHLDAG